MRRFFAFAAALAMVLSLSIVRAADEPAGKGTVTGSIMDKDGKAVADAMVRLVKAPAAKAPKNAAAENLEVFVALADPKPEKPEKPKKNAPVATAKTDAEGKFSMADVPAGEYQVVCQTEGQIGRKRITVAAGKTVTVMLKLKDQKAK